MAEIWRHNLGMVGAPVEAYLSIKETVDSNRNVSVLRCTLEIEAILSHRFYASLSNVTLKVDGTTAISFAGNNNQSLFEFNGAPLGNWGGVKELAVTEITIKHNADGTKPNVSIGYAGIFRLDDESIPNIPPTPSISTTSINLSPIDVHTLSISEGVHSTITVLRTSSGYGSKTELADGAYLYDGDTLKITFTPEYHYEITQSLVNDLTFISGGTYTVVGDVEVLSVAEYSVSKLGATDANIGSVSAITITKFTSTDYHSIQYSFGSLTGYIAADGSVSNTEVKYQNTSVSFLVPTTFYAQIPNAAYGTVTLTCRTYTSASSTTAIGTRTATFRAIANQNDCLPSVSGTVTDTNTVTVYLTGNSNTLVRYKSTVQCTVIASGNNAATIVATYVNGTSTSDGTVTFTNSSATSFVFTAVDSRGYSASYTVNPTVVDYIVLTCNPAFSRPSPTSTDVNLDVSGNYFNSTFGAHSNTLTVQWRYREVGGTYSSFATISSGIVTGSTTYFSNSPILLGSSFDYNKSYEFQIRVRDGVTGHVLTTVTKTVQVSRGIPIFDWGNDDFNINVELRLSGSSIFDLIYPVGSVYFANTSTMPGAIASIGTWSGITTGITGVYGWERTA